MDSKDCGQLNAVQNIIYYLWSYLLADGSMQGFINQISAESAYVRESKMLNSLKILTGFAACSMMVSVASANDEIKSRSQQSKQAVQEFAGQLKGELQSAMKSKGPMHAVDVCHKKAPEIAQQLSEKYGWEISRTSLKARNAGNQPDAWEKSVLEKFEQRKADGEDVKPMAHAEIVETDGKKQFRFMKAIPTGGVCLTCHGDNIATELKAKIDELYPQDAATGFKEGDIRGAFSITQPM